MAIVIDIYSIIILDRAILILHSIHMFIIKLEIPSILVVAYTQGIMDIFTHNVRVMQLILELPAIMFILNIILERRLVSQMGALMAMLA